MIKPQDLLVIQWVELADICFDDQPVNQAGVDFYLSLFQGNNDHVAPPILNADMSIRDGRHRLHAHIQAGRTHARCIIVHSPAGRPADPISRPLSGVGAAAENPV